MIPDLNRLSDCHIQVLKLMLEDRKPKEIAASVGLSPHTIYHKINRVRMVLNCKDKSLEELKSKFK